MTDRSESRDAVVIERTVAASPELVWAMWTQPEHFAAWYGPGGATITVVTMDVRVGGTRLVRMEMTTPNGATQMWFTGEYREVVANQRLRYTESFSDAAGNVLAPADLGMPAGHPTTTVVLVELEDLGGRTAMHLTHSGIPAGSPGATGWTIALDKLVAYLATQAAS